MSQYFSRLAERSGLAASAQALQSSSARARETVGWGEQSSEVIAQPGPFVTGSTAENSDSSAQPASAYRQNFFVDVPVAMPETNRRVIANSSSISEPSTVASGDINPDFEYSPKIARSMSPAISPAGQTAMGSNPVASSADTTKHEVSEHTTIAAKSSKQMAIENSVRPVHRQSNGLPADDTTPSFTETASHINAATTVKTRTMNPDASIIEQTESGKAVAPSRENKRLPSTARIASQPAQIITDGEIASRSSSRPSVQVSIGRIELEIHAPAKPAVPAPQAARTTAAPAQTPARNSAFNPHRHYLRSR